MSSEEDINKNCCHYFYVPNINCLSNLIGLGCLSSPLPLAEEEGHSSYLSLPELSINFFCEFDFFAPTIGEELKLMANSHGMYSLCLGKEQEHEF